MPLNLSQIPRIPMLTSIMPQDTMSEVTQALTKLESFDADLRYMGLSDLKVLFEGPQRQTLVSDHYHVLQQVKKEIVKHLADPITEVQTQAVKTLGPLVRLLPDNEVITILSTIATQKASTVLTLALRTIIGNSEPGTTIAQVLVDLVLDRDADPDYQTSIEDCEVVNDLLRRFGPYLQPQSIDRLLRHVMARICQPQSSPGNLVRRRSFEALGLLAPYENEDQWEAQRQFVGSTLEPPSPDINGVQLVINLCETAPDRIKSIPSIFDRILAIADSIKDDDSNVELVERALAATERLYLDGYIGVARVAALAQKYLQYHPNYVGGEESGDEDIGSEFEMSEDEEAYDDDLSWKLRRYAVKLSQEVAQHDEPHALPLVPSLIELLKVESEQGVRELAVEALVVFTASPTLYETCKPYIGTCIELAQKDSAGVYLSLLTALVSQHQLLPEQLEQVVVVAASQSKRATLPATLSLIHALASQVPSDPRLLAPVAQGLADVEFQTVSLALDAALALGNTELSEAVCRVVSNTRNLSIQGQALRVAAAMVDEQHAEAVLSHILGALQTTDLQGPAIHAFQELSEHWQLSDAAVTEAAKQLTQLLASSKLRAVASAILRALRHIVGRVPQLASSIFAAAQTHTAWEPAIVSYKCLLFAEMPTTPGVREFALAASNHFQDDIGNTHATIVKLWGALASTGDASDLLRVAETAAEAAGKSPLWAQIIAEVAIKGHLPIDVEFSEFGIYLVGALAERGRCTVSLAQLASAASPQAPGESVAPALVGQSLAELAIASEQQEQLYEAAASAQDSASAEMFISALEVMLQREPSLRIVSCARHLIEFVPIGELQIVGRLLAQAIGSLPGGIDLLDGWPVICQVFGAKHAFKTASPALQQDLEQVFLRYAEHGDLVVRENALESLSWALQQPRSSSQPGGLHPDVWSVLLRATFVDKSLVETIQVGPFKHTVDHGLAARKSAYEALYALTSHRTADTVRNHGEHLLAALVRGLRDEHDIRMLSLYTLETLAAVPAAARPLAEAKPQLVEAFGEIETAKVRETSVKQEHDRQAEALQTLATTRKALGW